MTIRHMQIFKAVCDHQSITHAAASLNMTQPAVSIAIRELESYYNTPLFDRIGRRIYLTEAGSILRSYTDSLLEQFDEAAAVLRSGGKLTRCRIGVNVSVGETLLPDMLDRLERAIPGIKTEIFIGNTRVVERRLADNQIDIAVADCITASPERVVSEFYTGSSCIVCSPDFALANVCGTGCENKFSIEHSAEYELDVVRLSQLRLLLREDGSGSRISLDSLFRAHGCTVEPIVESTSDLCLLTLARHGYGATILPSELVRDDISDGRLVELRLTDTELVRRYYLAYNKKKRLTGKISEAIECL
ncbi:MAG: LysR family transcriptional regulator, partial [Clostridiales bacterium]|nr:LysR family transcriptional regulator [Clostridiales bacterium]